MVIDSSWLFVNGLPVELERFILFLLISCRSEEASPSPELGCGQNERHSQPISHYGGRTGYTVLMSVCICMLSIRQKNRTEVR